MTTIERADAIIEKLLPLCEGKRVAEVTNLVRAEGKDTIDDLAYRFECDANASSVGWCLAMKAQTTKYPNYGCIIYDSSIDKIILTK